MLNPCQITMTITLKVWIFTFNRDTADKQYINKMKTWKLDVLGKDRRLNISKKKKRERKANNIKHVSINSLLIGFNLLSNVYVYSVLMPPVRIYNAKSHPNDGVCPYFCLLLYKIEKNAIC